MPEVRIFTKGGDSTSTTDSASAAWLLSDGWTEGAPTTYALPRTTAVRLDDHDVRIHDLEDGLANIQGVNVLQDPEFDSWTSPTQPGGWGTFWGVGTRNYFRETVAPYSGQNALGVTVIDSGGSGGLAWVGSAIFGVSGGAAVTARVFAKADTDTLSRMQLALFVAPPGGNPDHFGSGAVNLSGPQQILSTEWVEYTASWTVPAGNTQGRLYIGIDSPTPGATFTSYLDRAKAVVVEADVPDDTGWVTPTLANAWVDYGGFFATPGYRRINGVVHLKGLVKDGTASTIFTLPSDCRPNGNRIFSVVANNAFGRVDVQTDGLVNFGPGSNAFVALDGISFPVG